MKPWLILISILLAVSVILNVSLIVTWPGERVAETTAKTENTVQAQSPELEPSRDLGGQMMAIRSEKQSSAELSFLRKLALEEGAVKTAGEIDKFLRKKRKRLESMMQVMRKAAGAPDADDPARERARRRREIEEKMIERRLRKMRAEAPNDTAGTE